MMDRKLSLSLIVFSILAFTFVFSVQESSANVLIRNIQVTANELDLTSGVIQAGPGNGDYEIVICGIETNGANPFNAPTPGTWNELANLPCDNPFCQLGVWGRVVNSSASEDITCSWAGTTDAFVAASIRYVGVDTNNPIIDMACSEADGNSFTIDSVSSLPGAQLLTFQLFRIQSSSSAQDASFNELNGLFVTGVHYAINPDRVLAINGSTGIDDDGSGFEGFTFPRPTDVFDTKFCVISLRMASSAVPTMSEWGLISFAAFAGIAGIWYLRRRKAIA